MLVCEQVWLRVRMRALVTPLRRTSAHTQQMSLKIGKDSSFNLFDGAAYFSFRFAASLGPETGRAFLQGWRVSTGSANFRAEARLMLKIDRDSNVEV